MGINIGFGGVSKDRYPCESKYPSPHVSIWDKHEHHVNYTTVAGKSLTLPNPDPKNWKIVQAQQYGKYLLVKINYPDCTNYEGNKILLYEETAVAHLILQRLVDPHFSNNAIFKSPIARFEPTEKGWYLGETLAMHCDTLTK